MLVSNLCIFSPWGDEIVQFDEHILQPPEMLLQTELHWTFSIARWSSFPSSATRTSSQRSTGAKWNETGPVVCWKRATSSCDMMLQQEAPVVFIGTSTGQQRHRNQLSKRLLYETSASEDAEKSRRASVFGESSVGIEAFLKVASGV